MAISALLLAGPVAGAHDPLTIAREKIADAFRRGEAARLRPLLPAAGRVFVSIPSLGVRGGYISPDQCGYLMDAALDAHAVRAFRLAPVDPDARRDPDRHVAHGVLEFTSPDGEPGRIEIRFVLTREDGTWRLREVRENRAD
ncbi:MAG: hypothetical protein ACE5IK_02695 [Acidobacteriota bacterium]